MTVMRNLLTVAATASFAVILIGVAQASGDEMQVLHWSEDMQAHAALTMLTAIVVISCVAFCLRALKVMQTPLDAAPAVGLEEIQPVRQSLLEASQSFGAAPSVERAVQDDENVHARELATMASLMECMSQHALCRTQLHSEFVDLETLLQVVAHQAEPMARARGGKIYVRGHGAGPANAAMLSNALFLLVADRLQRTEMERPTLELCCAVGADNIEVRIWDNSADEESLSARRRERTSYLAPLSVEVWNPEVSRIVGERAIEFMGGVVWREWNPGAGSSLTVRLPLHAAFERSGESFLEHPWARAA